MAVNQGMSLIQSLLNLHKVEVQVRGLRSRLDNAQRYLATQDRALRELSQSLEELQSRKRQTQAKIANLET
jgi:chromosome segregation ATPase